MIQGDINMAQPWARKLWGIRMTSKHPLSKPMLVGSLWSFPMPKKQYEGEPTHALLFYTRAQAREWCKRRMETLSNWGEWKFTPVRVIESVTQIE